MKLFHFSRAIRLVPALMLLSCGGRSGLGPLADGGSDQRGAADALADRGIDPKACAALSGFAGGKRILGSPSRQVLFSKSLDRVFLLDQTSSTSSVLTRVALPSGPSTPLATDIHSIAWLKQDQILLATRVKGSAWSNYDLIAVDLSDDSQFPLAQGICGHRLSGDGNSLYISHGCGSDGLGTLDRMDTSSPYAPKTTWLGSKVSPYSLALSQDSRLAAFVADTTFPTGCSGMGTATIVSTAGQKTTVSKDTVYNSLQFLRDGRLVLRASPDCGYGQSKLWVHSAQTGLKVLTEANSWTYRLGSEFWDPTLSYAASSDGARILAGQESTHPAAGKLHGIRTDGSGPQLLASDLYPFWMTSMAFRACTFSNNGAWVLYTSTVTGSPNTSMGLTIIPASGGTPQLLASTLYSALYDPSPTTSEVAFFEVQKNDARRLGLAPLKAQTQSQTLYSTGQNPATLRWIPDGRGLVFVEMPTGGQATLRMLSRTGTSTSLGTINPSWFTPTYAPFVMDSTGCVIAFNRQTGSEPGTHLAYLPR